MARKSPVADRAAGLFQKTEDPEVPIHQQTASNRVKRTYYLPTDTLQLLKEIQLRRYRKTGEEPELSDLVAEGIKRLAGAPDET